MKTANSRRTAVTKVTDTQVRSAPQRWSRGSRPRSYLLAFGAVLLLTTACDNPVAQAEPTLNEELTALQSQVGDFESQVEEQTQALQSARQRVDELEAQLTEQEQQVGQAEVLEEERNGLRQQLLDRQTALERAQERVQTLEQRRELTLEERLASIDQRLDTLREERNQLNGQLEAAQGTPTATDTDTTP